MDKVRVRDLAKELGWVQQEVLAFLERIGVKGKSASSNLEGRRSTGSGPISGNRSAAPAAPHHHDDPRRRVLERRSQKVVLRRGPDPPPAPSCPRGAARAPAIVEEGPRRPSRPSPPPKSRGAPPEKAAEPIVELPVPEPTFG